MALSVDVAALTAERVRRDQAGEELRQVWLAAAGGALPDVSGALGPARAALEGELDSWQTSAGAFAACSGRLVEGLGEAIEEYQETDGISADEISKTLVPERGPSGANESTR